MFWAKKITFFGIFTLSQVDAVTNSKRFWKLKVLQQIETNVDFFKAF